MAARPVTLTDLIARDVQSRLLAALHNHPICLVSASVFGEDFVQHVVGDATTGQDVRYLVPDCVSLYRGVLIPTCHGLELVLPPNSDERMASVFRAQVDCLRRVSCKREQASVRDLIVQTVHPWVLPCDPTVSGSQDRILVEVPETATVCRSTPQGVFTSPRLNTGSDVSSGSSSTLSSGGDLSQPAVLFAVGDLVAVQCRLFCRDFPCTTPSGHRVFARVYALRATRVELVV
ncbi:hypothetical protein C8R46DRAFT_1218141 [Mycena filopes]|nr:hypothetical protein C8R46DRAFT_1218141 [Mycena filopes]